MATIDLSDLRRGNLEHAAVAIDAACRKQGFFAITNHGIGLDLISRFDELAREFFALGEDEKAAVSMDRGGLAWRGWFPLHGELTSGVPDEKEGYYLGSELTQSDPRVLAGLPLHGPNLFPERPLDFRDTALDYLEQVTELGQLILSAMAVGLGLAPTWFSEGLTANPTCLLRLFRYPSTPATTSSVGVGEHTDYGLLTLLATDGRGGLEVKLDGGWVALTPAPGTLVVNLGDMLERLTGGVYRSTVHRVVHHGEGDRISIPFFLDPGFDAVVPRLPIVERPIGDDAAARWDHASVHGFEGTYGEYLCAKVAKVFPALAEALGVEEGAEG